MNKRKTKAKQAEGKKRVKRVNNAVKKEVIINYAAFVIAKWIN